MIQKLLQKSIPLNLLTAIVKVIFTAAVIIVKEVN